MPCANRFGGPGTYFAGSLNRGVRTLVTSCPSGLSVGPVSTRATNPYASGISSQGWSNTIADDAMMRTPPATRRADSSLTGFGNENSSRVVMTPSCVSEGRHSNIRLDQSGFVESGAIVVRQARHGPAAVY
jgi:hypothetical protein